MPKLPQILAVPEKAPLYGSSRLVSRKERVCMNCPPVGTIPAELQGVSYVIRGEKSYELSNHLGNVLAVVSDRREAGACTDSLVDFYYADGRSVSDYYPFGMGMDSRTQSAGGYRWGFNGMEKYDDWQGEGNAYDFGARVYDSRLGRWVSVDPLFSKYPGLSPFNYTSNSPILYNDPNGKEILIYFMDSDKNVKYYKYDSGLPVPDNQFVQKTVEALNFLRERSEIADEIISDVVSMSQVLTIRQSAGLFSNRFNPKFERTNGTPYNNQEKIDYEDLQVNTGTVFIDLDVAMIFRTGNGGVGIGSPARGLMHEVIHGWNAFKSAKKFLKRILTKNSTFDTDEEEYTTNVENIIARDLCEDLRRDHSGNEIETISITSPNEASVTDESLNLGERIILD